jgi:hypothetical protein
MLEPKRTHWQSTAVAGTSATTIVDASGDPQIYRDLISLVITTTNSHAAATLTVSDGTNSFVLNYPNIASAPAVPLVVSFDAPLCQRNANSAWTVQASVNSNGYNVLAQFCEH